MKPRARVKVVLGERMSDGGSAEEQMLYDLITHATERCHRALHEVSQLISSDEMIQVAINVILSIAGSTAVYAEIGGYAVDKEAFMDVIVKALTELEFDASEEKFAGTQ
jgi:hypothetical protein